MEELEPSCAADGTGKWWNEWKMCGETLKIELSEALQDSRLLTTPNPGTLTILKEGGN
jgi:hypothetical protein